MNECGNVIHWPAAFAFVGFMAAIAAIIWALAWSDRK